MHTNFNRACHLAAYVGVALLGIFGLIDTTMMIIMVVVLMGLPNGRACLRPGKA